MKRFVEGEDRRQAVLLPEYLDDYVSEENPVRVIDVFVSELDLGALGFAGVVPEAWMALASISRAWPASGGVITVAVSAPARTQAWPVFGTPSQPM